MALQKGVLKVSGTLDTVNFYFRKGVPVARKSGGGFNGNAINNAPSMQRIRENNTEFGGVSRFKKQLRLALEPFFNLLHDTSLHGRMMQVFQEIKQLDAINERGKRTVFNGLHTQNGRNRFVAFDFTPTSNVKNTLGGLYSFDFTTYCLSVSDCNTILHLSDAATALQLKLVVVAFDFDTLSTETHTSLPTVLQHNTTETSFSLTPTSLPTTETPLFAFLQLQELQEINQIFYPLKTPKSTQLVCLDLKIPVV